jgi:ABC-type transport system involved in cytochrome c biogenesis permease subunit
MPLIILSFILGIAYFVLWIWQIFNARNLAKKFNESVRETGKEPW